MTNYNESRSYVVRSDAFVRVSFGSIALDGFSTLAVLVEFHGGIEYIYLGVSEELYNELEALVIRHCENGDVRVGSYFARNLFNGYRGYARVQR